MHSAIGCSAFRRTAIKLRFPTFWGITPVKSASQNQRDRSPCGRPYEADTSSRPPHKARESSTGSHHRDRRSGARYETRRIPGGILHFSLDIKQRSVRYRSEERRGGEERRS